MNQYPKDFCPAFPPPQNFLPTVNNFFKSDNNDLPMIDDNYIQDKGIRSVQQLNLSDQCKLYYNKPVNLLQGNSRPSMGLIREHPVGNFTQMDDISLKIDTFLNNVKQKFNKEVKNHESFTEIKDDKNFTRKRNHSFCRGKNKIVRNINYYHSEKPTKYETDKIHCDSRKSTKYEKEKYSTYHDKRSKYEKNKRYYELDKYEKFTGEHRESPVNLRDCSFDLILAKALNDVENKKKSKIEIKSADDTNKKKSQIEIKSADDTNKNSPIDNLMITTSQINKTYDINADEFNYHADITTKLKSDESYPYYSNTMTNFRNSDINDYNDKYESRPVFDNFYNNIQNKLANEIVQFFTEEKITDISNLIKSQNDVIGNKNGAQLSNVSYISDHDVPSHVNDYSTYSSDIDNEESGRSKNSADMQISSEDIKITPDMQISSEDIKIAPGKVPKLKDIDKNIHYYSSPDCDSDNLSENDHCTSLDIFTEEYLNSCSKYRDCANRNWPHNSRYKGKYSSNFGILLKDDYRYDDITSKRDSIYKRIKFLPKYNQNKYKYVRSDSHENLQLSPNKRDIHKGRLASTKIDRKYSSRHKGNFIPTRNSAFKSTITSRKDYSSTKSADLSTELQVSSKDKIKHVALLKRKERVQDEKIDQVSSTVNVNCQTVQLLDKKKLNIVLSKDQIKKKTSQQLDDKNPKSSQINKNTKISLKHVKADLNKEGTTNLDSIELLENNDYGAFADKCLKEFSGIRTNKRKIPFHPKGKIKVLSQFRSPQNIHSRRISLSDTLNDTNVVTMPNYHPEERYTYENEIINYSSNVSPVNELKLITRTIRNTEYREYF